jgi:hypothetical protein
LSRQANVNPKAELADQFKDKRRTVHIGSCKLMCGDLKANSEREAAAIKVWTATIFLCQNLDLTLSIFRSEWMQIAMALSALFPTLKSVMVMMKDLHTLAQECR